MQQPDYEAMGRYTVAIEQFQELRDARNRAAAEATRLMAAARLPGATFQPIPVMRLQTALHTVLEAEAQLTAVVDTINTLAGQLGRPRIFVLPMAG